MVPDRATLSLALGSPIAARIAPSRLLLQGVAVAVGIGASAFAVAYANQPILEAHGFRQTQTALTAFWMTRDGWRLAYETPVAGYPWSIPFEFPLYQAIVAGIVALVDAPFEVVGRLVSFAFLIACVLPARRIARRLDLSPEFVWVFCALLWSCPIYLFWARTFMIETTALLFSLATIAYAPDLADPAPRWRSVCLCCLFATLATLQKITTAGPVLVFLLGALAAAHLRIRPLAVPRFRQLLATTCALVVPLGAGAVWSAYTDAVKISNALGRQLTSAGLSDWNFGDLAQRLDPATYVTVFWTRVASANIAGWLGIVMVAAAIAAPTSRRTRDVVVACLVLFVLPVLIFTNLHLVHDYYQSSCALFLIAALAVSVSDWLPSVTGRPALVPILTILLVAINVEAFAVGYGKVVRAPISVSGNRTLAIADVLRRSTPAGTGFVAFGYDWSSELSYYAQRKSFTVPTWFSDYSRAWERPADFLGDAPLSAVVVCPTEGSPTERDTERKVQAEPQWRPVSVQGCRVLINSAVAATKTASARIAGGQVP